MGASFTRLEGAECWGILATNEGQSMGVEVAPHSICQQVYSLEEQLQVRVKTLEVERDQLKVEKKQCQSDIDRVNVELECALTTSAEIREKSRATEDQLRAMKEELEAEQWKANVMEFERDARAASRSRERLRAEKEAKRAKHAEQQLALAQAYAARLTEERRQREKLEAAKRTSSSSTNTSPTSSACSSGSNHCKTSDFSAKDDKSRMSVDSDGQKLRYVVDMALEFRSGIPITYTGTINTAGKPHGCHGV